MRKIALSVLLFVLAASVPAFASHPVGKHPKAVHPTNPYLKHPDKHTAKHLHQHR